MGEALRNASEPESVVLKEDWFDQLAAADKVPADLVEACLAHFDVVAPRLRVLLIRMAEGEKLNRDDENALF